MTLQATSVQAQLYDVVVYGATAAGAIAAIAAANEGAKVALLEPGRHLGGMVSAGLGYTDVGHLGVIGGYALEFYERVGARYGGAAWSWVGPEPHVAEDVFRGWLEQADVEVVFDQRLDALSKRKRCIERVRMSSGATYGAAVFIDASYEGDLMARAGVSYTVGREGVRQYGESWAGRQPLRPGQHNFDVFVSPFKTGDSGELLPLIHARPPVAIGEADEGVQAYGFRLCLTHCADNQLPFPEPEGYDPDEFELLRRYLTKKGDALQANELLVLKPNLPNGKCDVNSKGPISTNLLDGSNWAYAEADEAQREAIWQRHLHYTQSLLYFLANDPAVPVHIRQEINRWGLCQDEFVDCGGWPHQLYVRVARRMVGEYVMTQQDLQEHRIKYDAVGLGSYHIDVREVQRIWDYVHLHPHLVPAVFNEGYISVPVEPYEIPYRSIEPRYHECENLLVPVCMSASNVAFASIRMEPQFMILGQSAGTAAAMAARNDVPVQRVSVAALQQRLSDKGQSLALSRLSSDV